MESGVSGLADAAGVDGGADMAAVAKARSTQATKPDFNRGPSERRSVAQYSALFAVRCSCSRFAVRCLSSRLSVVWCRVPGIGYRVPGTGVPRYRCPVPGISPDGSRSLYRRQNGVGRFGTGDGAVLRIQDDFVELELALLPLEPDAVLLADDEVVAAGFTGVERHVIFRRGGAADRQLARFAEDVLDAFGIGVRPGQDDAARVALRIDVEAAVGDARMPPSST